MSYVCYLKPFLNKQLKQQSRVLKRRSQSYSNLKDFDENLLEIENIHGKSTDEYQKLRKYGVRFQKNIDLISSHQRVLNQLYDTNISISETVPEIQAEYNLMVDQMARQGLPSSQVIIAKTRYLLQSVFYVRLTRC